MIRYSAEAIDQIDAFRLHYVAKSRIEAALALDRALDRAEQIIGLHPGAGLVAPRPYPSLERPGRLWVKSGRYWIAYRVDDQPIVLGVFYDAADIPGRS